MRQFFVLLKREISSYFLSPIAYVMICFFMAVMGLGFWTLITVLVEGARQMTVMRTMLGESIFFWIVMLIAVPVTTMRIFAEERRSGTFESLMTAPVRDATVVLAKYFGAFFFFVVMWLPTLSYIWILRHFSPGGEAVDIGTVLSSYLGVLLLSAAYLSVGILTSALTRSQIAAAIICFTMIFTAFLAGFVPYFFSNTVAQSVGDYFSSIGHMIDFSRGAVDTRPIVLYLSITVLTLFVTVRVVESRRWK